MEELPAQVEQRASGGVLVADDGRGRVLRVALRGGPGAQGAFTGVERGLDGGGVLALLGDLQVQRPGLGARLRRCLLLHHEPSVPVRVSLRVPDHAVRCLVRHSAPRTDATSGPFMPGHLPGQSGRKPGISVSCRCPGKVMKGPRELSPTRTLRRNREISRRCRTR
ncbi:hypothetical protein SCOCK_400076 [Actinacidiphila cocklensis]|uniref:Uncharacterized protein n=1 Tax=Actinacidiphila cocklensis TaxID=887465 RepID=A0A9W4DVV7_9ACTN|nr:hypothetical protein SCOCK_400076 [Actinacidiphila cocklensis]